ncbi:MAG: RloB family protein [Acidimicrobiaceae bacterium]|nr:RloB family protein [Acidimicrobiaceae bacterium]
MKRRRSHRRTVRLQPGRAPADRKQIYVFVEGDTEKDYLEHWHRRFRADVHVVIDDFRGSPRRLVEEAAKQRKQDVRDERRSRGRVADEYWCVFDRDEHQDFDEAIAVAAASGITVAHSNPCFELWFILHFRDQTAWIHRHDAQDESEGLLRCRKRLTLNALETLDEFFADARRRARQLDEWHEGNDSPLRSNPSSGVWGLVERIAHGA